MIRNRILPDLNYRAVFFNGKTLRQKYNPDLQFLPQLKPEIEDIGINTLCYANCNYCYTSATKKGINFDNIVEKAKKVYGDLDLNSRPFQVAIGGSGEATLHPDFSKFIKTLKSLQILPNYTTNGMHLNQEILEVTKEFVGGVAVSYHPHIKQAFYKGIDNLLKYNIKTNVHFILGEEGSTEKFWQLYKELDTLEYFVILPYQAVGRAKKISVELEWQKFFQSIKNIKLNNIAFGALFYDYLIENDTKHLDLDIYEPEVFSGYRLFDDSYNILRKSSYDLRPKFETIN